MAIDGEVRCFDGSLYRFSAESGGDPGGYDDGAQGLEKLIALLKPISDHYKWAGIITPMEFVVPENTQRLTLPIYPAARTIRIEANAPAQLWLNDVGGIPIRVGGEQRVFSISDLPPAAAIHDLIVTTQDETKFFVMAVA